MANNPVGFEITNSTPGWNGSDFDDVFVRKDCFLEGGLWLWGSGGNNALGNQSTLDRSSPVQTVSGGTNWKNVGVGCVHTAAIKTDGTLWVWGANTNGVLGTNNLTNANSPVQTVSNVCTWKQVSVSCLSSSATKIDGSLWLWGNNTDGRLGDNTILNKSSPVQTISEGTNWRQVSVATSHSAAIKTDGTLWTWGSAADGKLGNNATTNRSSPVQTFSSGTDWKQVSASTRITAAIKTNGELWLWGWGSYLGVNNTLSVSSPVQTVTGGTNWKEVDGADCHTAAVKTDGTLWLWGANSNGQLGFNNVAPASSPIQTISAGTNWKTVSLARFVSTAIKTDGTLWTWGNGLTGRIGNDSVINRSSPVQTISGGTSWRRVNTSFYTVATIREDCW